MRSRIVRIVQNYTKLRNTPLIPAIVRASETILNYDRTIFCMKAVRDDSILPPNCFLYLSASATHSISSLPALADYAHAKLFEHLLSRLAFYCLTRTTYAQRRALLWAQSRTARMDLVISPPAYACVIAIFPWRLGDTVIYLMFADFPIKRLRSIRRPTNQ